jgi:mono/diheme cytochrome c family protein
MADYFLLGLFHEATPTADTIEDLRDLGISDDKVTVMSGIPYRSDILGRRQVYERLVLIALIGALSGFIAAVFLMAGTPILYPVHVGGQPLIPIPPTIIIMFEFTMLGAMVATFGGLVAQTRYPSFGQHVYDKRITEGHIGVLVQVGADLVDQAQQVLVSNGAHHLKRTEAVEPIRRINIKRWSLVIILLFIPTLIGLLLVYGTITLPIPSQMINQASIGYSQGPRMSIPAGSVPFEGPALISGQPASEPLPATQDSIQRGKVLFNIYCAICHGEDGTGDGKVGVFFTPHPANLTSDGVQNLTSNDIFLVITQGRGVMPSQAEGLSILQRWDVVNYVHSLKK